MGNAIALLNRSGAGKGKVVLPDGTVLEYDKPLTVAELMMEHPQQVVVEFPSAKAHRQRPAPLPADKSLEMNRVYVMVPVQRGKPAAASLSSEEARRILLRANSFLKLNSFGGCGGGGGGGGVGVEGLFPLFGRMCAAGVYAKIPSGCKEVNDYLMDNGGRREVLTEGGEVAMEEAPEFLTRQVSGKGWKPSLDTITEKSMHTKVRHWLF